MVGLSCNLVKCLLIRTINVEILGNSKSNTLLTNERLQVASGMCINKSLGQVISRPKKQFDIFGPTPVRVVNPENNGNNTSGRPTILLKFLLTLSIHPQSIALIPRILAFFSFEPALEPKTTKSVFADTEPAT